MVLREHPSIESCHQSCDLYIHYRGPTHLRWVDHPADELVQLTNSYTSSVKNMTSESSVQFHQAIEQISSVRMCEMKVHFIMIRLRPFRHFVRPPANSSVVLRTTGDLTLHKRLVLFLHHPHMEGWQRVHHSPSFVRERWH